MFKKLFKMLFCKHEYKMKSNLSYRHIPSNNRIHEITLVCTICGRIKILPLFYTTDNSDIN